MAERAGWGAVAARRIEGAERRFILSGAGIAVVDARGALAEGLAAVRALADPVEANAGALLAVLARTDVAALNALYEAGATHYLASPFGEAEFAQMLRFAGRHAERMAGGRRAQAGREALRQSEALGWRWRRGARTVRLSPALAALHDGEAPGGEVALRRALKTLGREGRRAARRAFERLGGAGASTAFAHADAAGRRIAHHLTLEEDGTTLVGRVEPLGGSEAPEASGVGRDALTGLEDNGGARRWIEARLAARGRSGEGAGPALLLIAATRFETVNAAYGRSAGDALLQAIGRRIERLAGQPRARRRLVARLAGAEFLVGLPQPSTLAEAQLLAAEILAAVARPFVAGDHVVAMGCRIGIATVDPAETIDAPALLRRASVALADAKAADGPVIRVLAAGDAARAAEDSQLEIDLRLALEQDEIEILFQPQVAVTGGRIVGVEALARWQHPELGELGAETLFAAAERSDFLLPLSQHIQRKAIAAVAGWPATLAGLRIAINVTAADIASPGFAEAFIAGVDEAGVARPRVTVEITESGLIADLSAAAGLLARLRAAGCRVAIDDFGTGYSSLAYLKALPLDYLKLDKGLSQDISGSARGRIVVRSVIDMARSLGLSVIAEGVETEAQLALLAREGCNYYQGFLCAPPLDSAALAVLVEAQGTPLPPTAP